MEYVLTAGTWVAYVVMGLLCLAGIVLSCLSISGTWLVVAAAALAAAIAGPGFPSWWVVVIFVTASAMVEGCEALAGGWGVKRRGGSSLAGLAAIGGGIVGMIAGGFVPPPIVAGIVGMFAGSFVAAFAVERYRMQKSADDAARIAMGAVLARIGIMFLKTIVALAMTTYLLLGAVMDRT